MSNIAAAEPMPQTTAEYEAEFKQIMAEADGIHEQMRLNRADIERLKQETQAIAKDTARMKNETRAMLAGMGVKL